MGVFDNLKQPELQKACADRQLSAGGSNAEMIARLEEHEANLLLSAGLGDDSPAAAAPPAAPDGPPAPQFDLPDEPTPAVGQLAGTGEVLPVEYVVAYPCPSELTTGLHESFRSQAYNQAVAHGKEPKGGLAGVHRKGWETVGGVRHALYSVPLRKK